MNVSLSFSLSLCLPFLMVVFVRNCKELFSAVSHFLCLFNYLPLASFVNTVLVITSDIPEHQRFWRLHWPNAGWPIRASRGEKGSEMCLLLAVDKWRKDVDDLQRRCASHWVSAERAAAARGHGCMEWMSLHLKVCARETERVCV